MRIYFVFQLINIIRTFKNSINIQTLGYLAKDFVKMRVHISFLAPKIQFQNRLDKKLCFAQPVVDSFNLNATKWSSSEKYQFECLFSRSRRPCLEEWKILSHLSIGNNPFQVMQTRSGSLHKEIDVLIPLHGILGRCMVSRRIYTFAVTLPSIRKIKDLSLQHPAHKPLSYTRKLLKINLS